MISKKTICLGITILTAVILKLIYPSLTSEDLKFVLHPVSEVMSEPGLWIAFVVILFILWKQNRLLSLYLTRQSTQL